MTSHSLATLTTSAVTEKRAQSLDVEFNEMIPPMSPTLKLLRTFLKKASSCVLIHQQVGLTHLLLHLQLVSVPVQKY